MFFIAKMRRRKSWNYIQQSEANEKYDEFTKNSPGIDIDTNGINYGVGHAHDKS